MILADCDEGATLAALRESEARLRAFVTASTDVVYRMSPDWSEMQQLDGRGFLVSTDQPRRAWLEEYVFDEDQEKVREAVAAAIQNKHVFDLEHRVRRLDGSVGWTHSRAVPVLDDAGEIMEWFGAASDVTLRHEARDALANMTEELARQKWFYEDLISATPDLVYAFDRQYRFTFANQALLSMWGKPLEGAIGKTLLENGYEPWHAEMHEREIDQVFATGEGVRGEVGFPHAALGWRTYDYIFMPICNSEGEVEAIAGTTRDITDIKLAEEHLRLLINELNHRVKNTLATIQSIAAQTFSGTAGTPEARLAFEGRLIALSNAHSVLTRTNWERADLGEVVKHALNPFDDGNAPGRMTVQGPEQMLRPQQALAIAMALHELSTNAMKFGAWSVDRGHVHIQWSRDECGLRLEWRESGGPAVTTPSRRGFGTRQLKTGLAYQLHSVVTLDFREEGVTCTLEVPVSELL